MKNNDKRAQVGLVKVFAIFLAAFVLFTTGHGTAIAGAEAPDKAAVQECLLKALKTAPGSMTVDELKAKCQAEQVAVVEEKQEAQSIIDARIYTDDQNILRPFTLMAHRPNYILLAAYNNDPNNEPYREAFDDPSIELDDVESQFQLSIKMPLGIDLFKNKVDIYAAFTLKAFWQVYNSEISAPFRETNYEPEAWVQFRPDWSFWGIKNSVNLIGFNHQSNGRAEPLSRSWNRIFANFVFEKGNLVFNIKPWYRIQEDEEDDNNPDITDYLGHFQVGAAYKWREHTFSVMSRNNLESGFSEGAVELTWSFPLGSYKYLKGYILGFTGYGQSLVDYNVHHSSIGIGFALTDWL
jgi:phospholipase A1